MKGNDTMEPKPAPRRACTGVLDIFDSDCALFAGQIEISPPTSPVQMEACHGYCTWIVFGAGLTLGLVIGWWLCRLHQRVRWIMPTLRNARDFARMDDRVARPRAMPPGANEFGELE